MAHLMDQIKVAENRLFMCTEFEQYVLSSEFVGRGQSIIASVKNVTAPVVELTYPIQTFARLPSHLINLKI
jgi:hypothetical protein